MQCEQKALKSFHYLKKIPYSVRLYLGIILLLGSILLVMFHFFGEAFYDNLVEKREKRLSCMTEAISDDMAKLYQYNGKFVPASVERRLSRYDDEMLECFDQLSVGYYDLKNNYIVSQGALKISQKANLTKYDLSQLSGSSKRIHRYSAMLGRPDTSGMLLVFPVHYRNKIVGYAWSQSKITDLAQRKKEISASLLNSVYVVFIVGLMGAYIINYYSRKTLFRFAKDVILLEENEMDYQVEIPELNLLLEEVVKNRQNRLYQAVFNERMATIAQLSAGLAHDIRNPLTSVRGFLQILENRVSTGDRELIQISIEELDSINRLIQDMLFLVDPPKSNFQSSDISKVAENVISFLAQEALEKDIQVRIRTKAALPSIRFDFEQIKLALINIIRNAFEAIQGKNGCVEIIICSCHKKNKLIIIVKDNGIGFSHQLNEKIFDPLFTTKNNGSGLGLPICKEIIANHNGMLNIKSRPELGTIVSIFLPL